MKKLSLLLSSLFLSITLFPVLVLSSQTGDVVNYNFFGSFVVSTPCTVNNDEVINILFGNVGINRVNGSDYMQVIPYYVDCHGAPDNSPLILTISGSATGYDQAALITSADGLGIQIQANGVPMLLNKALSTTLSAVSSMALTAVPVKDPSKSLSDQPFTATATLTAEYQ